MINLVLWSAQAVAVIAVAALLAQLLKSVPPAARLAFWQVALVASLMLPVLRPWQQETVTAIRLVPARGIATGMAAAAPAGWQMPSTSDCVLMLLAAGILVKLALLCVGLFRLRQYRREAEPFPAGPEWSVEATILASDAVSSPVTFGFLKPAILVPTSFAELDGALRDPILFHEVLHVRRRDWLFALGEETLRSLLWFHPGIWYAVREIQLAREETVDREVVATMKARETYVDALLAIAGALKGPEMATAPFFLRRSHLKRRVVSLFKEVSMSKTKTASSLIAACAVMALASWFVTGALPLKAAPQEVQDGAGVSVDMNGARLMHRNPVSYPGDALAKGVQGTVTAQVKLDGRGNVIDATVTAGPDELRKAVLQSVLNWHFTSDAANSIRQIIVTFAAPKTVSPAAPQPAVAVRNAVPPPPGAIRQEPPRIASISAPGGLQLGALPVHVGDVATTDAIDDLQKTVHDYDEHYTLALKMGREGVDVSIAAPVVPRAEPAASASSNVKTLRVGGNVQANNLVSQVRPVYPPLAKAARVQGTVKFDATIGPDGTVQNLQLLSGPPLLAQAAMQAVQQWVYKPTLLNGSPVSVVTTIDVNFTLAEQN